MTKRWCKYGILTFVCFLCSCSRVPKQFLSEKEMRVVLYDMHIAEAMVETNSDMFRTSDERERLYQGVFAKHHITQAKYDSSLIWYGKNMDLYMRIYKMVTNDISESIAKLGDIKPNPLSGEMSTRDSIDVWIDNNSYIFHPKQIFQTLIFEISPERPYSAGSSYVMGLSVWGLSPGTKQKLRLGLRALQSDTIISVNQDVYGDGYYETVMRTATSKPVIRIYGYIRMEDDDSPYHQVYVDDIRLMKYNLDSKALTAPIKNEQ